MAVRAASARGSPRRRQADRRRTDEVRRPKLRDSLARGRTGDLAKQDTEQGGVGCSSQRQRGSTLAERRKRDHEPIALSNVTGELLEESRELAGLHARRVRYIDMLAEVQAARMREGERELEG
ncbi:MAG: hypothetical protein JWN04_4587 [Myxococcaceae bacterium]|nr:hypothetical protein [Myxococcaceae bacterium]